MHRQLAIATSRDFPELIPDDRKLRQECERRGLSARPAIWSEAQDWSQFSAVLLRSIWDYYLRLPDFIAWLDQLRTLGVRLINPQELVRWNLDKRYLADLRDRGVPIVQTHFIEPQTNGEQAMQQIAALPWPELVLKPAVSAGAYRTVRLERAALRSGQTPSLVSEILATSALLVQPLLPEITTVGEHSLVFFDGLYSHAVRKLPAAGDFRVQEKHGGTFEAVTAPGQLIEQAKAVLQALPVQPLYARVDGVVRDGTLALMEVELIEPDLFLSAATDAPSRLAEILNATV